MGPKFPSQSNDAVTQVLSTCELSANPYQENNVIVKNAIILNIIQNIFNLHKKDKDVVVFIILVLFKRAYGFNHYINIDKFLYNLSLTGIQVKIGKKRGTVFSHNDVDDLLKNVPSELDRYVIEKKLEHTSYYVMYIAEYCNVMLN